MHKQILVLQAKTIVPLHNSHIKIYDTFELLQVTQTLKKLSKNLSFISELLQSKLHSKSKLSLLLIEQGWPTFVRTRTIFHSMLQQTAILKDCFSYHDEVLQRNANDLLKESLRPCKSKISWSTEVHNDHILH